MEGKLLKSSLVARSQAFLESKALYIVCKFQFADHLKDGPLSAAEIAARANTDPDMTDRFLKFLSLKDVFHRVSEKVYENTPMSDYLRSDHPESVRPVIMLEDFVARCATGLAGAMVNPSVQAHQVAFNTQMPIWEFLASQKEEQENFNLATVNWTAIDLPLLLADYDWAKHGTAAIVDVGGGIGHVTAALLRQHPFTGVIFDVAVNGEQYWREHYADVVSRASFVQGSFFEPLSIRGDLYLLRHVLHGWQDREAVAILSRVAAAMQETKRSDPSKRPLALIVEGLYDFPPVNKRTPESDMTLMLVGGRERQQEEYERLCRAAGLRVVEVVPGTAKDAVIELELLS